MVSFFLTHIFYYLIQHLMCIHLGSGEYSFANGSKYVGEYNLGMKHGQGKYIFTDGQSYYFGKWENNLMSGNGEQVFSNGDKYTGNYENNKCHGQGKIYVKASNTTYVGGKFKEMKNQLFSKYIASNQLLWK